MNNDRIGNKISGDDEGASDSCGESRMWPRRRALKAIPLLGAGAVFAPALAVAASEQGRARAAVNVRQLQPRSRTASNTELYALSIEDLSNRLRTKEVSPVTLVNAYLERIQGAGKPLNAFILVLAEQALADARRAEQEIVSGHYRGPLHGIPIALKDLYDLRGVPTTGASKLFIGNIAKEDAPSVARLKKAGAIIIGKTNMNELALGATGENSAFGPVHNPWMTDHITGGSSAGSGAGVAAGLCAAATGSDTGGSIRIPSALCGVV